MKLTSFFVSTFILFQASLGLCVSSSLHPKTGHEIPHLSKLQEIADYGIAQVGGVDLISVIKEAQELKVFINYGEPNMIQNKARRSAKCCILSREVFLNVYLIGSQHATQAYEKDVDMDPTLFFHEILIALGYNDYKYQISSILALTHQLVDSAKNLGRYSDIYQTQLEAWQKYLLNLKFERLFDPAQINKTMKGGSTTTEGGGDYSAALYKTQLLYHLIVGDEKSTGYQVEKLSILRFILGLRIEVDWAGKRTGIHLEQGHKVFWLPPYFSLNSLLNKQNLNASESALMPESVLRQVGAFVSKRNSCRAQLE